MTWISGVCVLVVSVIMLHHFLTFGIFLRLPGVIPNNLQ